MTVAVGSILRVAAGHGLATPGAPFTVTRQALPAVLAGADGQRLIGLLDQALADGALQAEGDVREDVAEAAVRVQAWCLLVERHHLAVHDVLRSAGIEHRFLKGPTTAHRFYDHPGLRPFRDVDVLVRGEDIDEVSAILLGQGHSRPDPELAAGFDSRYGKSVDLRSDVGVEVDVHRTLASGPFGIPSLDPLWARSATDVIVGGASLPALDPTASFVHACIHAVTGARTVTITLRDVVASAPADLRDANGLADAIGASACVTAACAKAAVALDGVPDRIIAQATADHTTRRERRRLDVYETRRTYRRLAVSGLGAVPGLSGKARYLSVMARAQRASRRRRP